MGLINLSICLTDLPKDKITQAANGKKYINLTVAARKEVGKYGETHTVFVNPSKQDKDTGKPTVYVGSGKEFNPLPQPQPLPQHVTPEAIGDMPTIGDDDNLPF